MRLIVQRVQRAAVRVGGEVAAEIGPGLAILVGVRTTDTPAEAQALAEKVAHLRIFSDEAGKLNRSVLEVGGAVLSVPQFTLYADASKGRRPSFVDAAGGAPAESIYEAFNRELQALGVPVAAGRFGAVMLVEIFNDGPVTILLERERADAGPA
ncbi:MAG: D-tyrosyl-tRNA(Tyr) deacylase, D-tyrosyl-tRNA(Tyr) deacylase [Armatimonadetes bacterium CSP1-3]|nr:MAG: D-tyrosyl-tRNA(Tyr) deacylase, D-tyrosyl-tRNA(Tyr) deacylase [Armatimonadetes bacterium CSP1-3]